MLNRSFLTVGDTPVSLWTVIVVLAVIALSFWVSHLLRRAIDIAAARRPLLDTGGLASLKRLLHYIVVVVGFAVAMSTVGIDLGALFAAGAIFAVGVGFAMQNLAQNFVSGVILLVERTIQEGDVLTMVEDHVGIERSRSHRHLHGVVGGTIEGFEQFLFRSDWGERINETHSAAWYVGSSRRARGSFTDHQVPSGPDYSTYRLRLEVSSMNLAVR